MQDLPTAIALPRKLPPISSQNIEARSSPSEVEIAPLQQSSAAPDSPSKTKAKGLWYEHMIPLPCDASSDHPRLTIPA
jgi:hypothetical protein